MCAFNSTDNTFKTLGHAKSSLIKVDSESVFMIYSIPDTAKYIYFEFNRKLRLLLKVFFFSYTVTVELVCIHNPIHYLYVDERSSSDTNNHVILKPVTVSIFVHIFLFFRISFYSQKPHVHCRLKRYLQ